MIGAVSFAISGTERNHNYAIEASYTVNHLLKHIYVKDSVMLRVILEGKGCSVLVFGLLEIMAVAHMLETDIYTFGKCFPRLFPKGEPIFSDKRVPANVAESVQSLPRTQEHEFIRIKLKRKLSYKGYYEYQFINKQHVEDALNYLRANNKWYNDIVIEHEWINPVPEDSNQQNSDCHEEDEDECNSDVDEITDEERLCGVRLDSCMQPADIGQEILDQYFDDVFCVAPCEGINPVRLLMEEGNEAKCFPRLFPKGEPIFSDKRDVRLTLCRYLHNRLMNVVTAAGCAVEVYLSIFYIYIFVFTLRISYILKLLKYIVIGRGC